METDEKVELEGAIEELELKIGILDEFKEDLNGRNS